MAKKSAPRQRTQKAASSQRVEKKPLSRSSAVRKPVTPMREMGTSGTPIFGGYVQVIETHEKLQRGTRYRTAGDLLANVAIISAGMRFFTNLMAKPSWTMTPAGADDDDGASGEAQELAEFMETVIGDLTDNWSRVIRRTGLYRFHGFGIQEWTAKRRTDGMIGLDSIEPRPSYSIEKWDIEETGAILGVWQRSPQTGRELYIPRRKFLYLVDDVFTDSPEGMGLFRSLVDSGERYQEYQRMESQGFERDMRGIPIGLAPIAELNELLKDGEIDQEHYDAALAGMKKMVQAQRRKSNTGLMMDSETYKSTTADGQQVATTPKWGFQLLRGDAPDFEQIGLAIERLRFDMAMVLGTEGLLLGGTDSGSRALSGDKSQNLYLAVNGALADLAQAVKQDIVEPIWRLNGFPEELMPTPTVEDITFRDIENEAAIIRDLATAGAVLDVEDPIIDWFRTRLGAPPAPEITTADRDDRSGGGGAAAGAEDDDLEEDDEGKSE